MDIRMTGIVLADKKRNFQNRSRTGEIMTFL